MTIAGARGRPFLSDIMISSPAYFYTLLDPIFFESLDRYSPTDEFIEEALHHVGDEWTVSKGGFWTYLHPPDAPRLYQGWKIHLSSSEENGLEVLKRICPILSRFRTPFKFCSDSRMLALSLIKNWPRTGAGKFVTIYPRDVDAFKVLLEECYAATRGMVGPYILSDRPYRDSRTVFYRYGEHFGRSIVNSYGVRTPTLISDAGEKFSDERVAYFRLPPWVEDPFDSAPPATPPGEEGVLLHDRYRVGMAIKFSSVGGIYQAYDTVEEQDVIIREARPMLARASIGYDALKLLEKEARILNKLGETGLVPRLVDLFQEWEHSFLVQELLHAESLWGYAMNFAFSDGASPASMYEGILDTAHKIMDGLDAIHDRRIVLRDMTRSNVLFTEDDQVKFIDMEFAYELDSTDPPVAGWTPGYASPDQLQHKVPCFEDDHYALGALILDMIAFTAPGFELNRAGLLRSLEIDLADLRQPRVLLDIVEGLTAADSTQRWRTGDARRAFEMTPPPMDERPLFPQGTRPPDRDPPSAALRGLAEGTIDGLMKFMDAHADHSRNDRLWPASGEVFHTNPVHLQYGAVGTAYFQLHARRETRDRDLEWILDHLSTRPLPPTLYTGIGGVALYLSDVGHTEDACELMTEGHATGRFLDLPNLYYGGAGWGIANLALWERTGGAQFLEQARETGVGLIERATEDENGLSWESDGFVRLGYGEGQSGIATFFAYLYAATGIEEYRDAAVRALEFDLAYVEEVPHGVLWYPHTDPNPGDPKSPHMRYGTAGIGTAALRVWKATGDPRFLEWAERCAFSVSKRYTNKVWHDYGTAGYGELLLDMYAFTNEPDFWLNTAWYLAERLIANRVMRPEGIAYLGRDLLRLSCDFGMGGAGIGLLLYRTLHPSTPRLILPDRILHSWNGQKKSARAREGVAYANA